MTTPYNLTTLGWKNCPMMAASCRNFTLSDFITLGLSVFTATSSGRGFAGKFQTALFTLPNCPEPKWPVILRQDRGKDGIVGSEGMKGQERTYRGRGGRREVEWRDKIKDNGWVSEKQRIKRRGECEVDGGKREGDPKLGDNGDYWYETAACVSTSLTHVIWSLRISRNFLAASCSYRFDVSSAGLQNILLSSKNPLIVQRPLCSWEERSCMTVWGCLR